MPTKNSLKTETNLFPQCATPHENQIQSQISRDWLQPPSHRDIIIFTRQVFGPIYLRSDLNLNIYYLAYFFWLQQSKSIPNKTHEFFRVVNRSYIFFSFTLCFTFDYFCNFHPQRIFSSDTYLKKKNPLGYTVQRQLQLQLAMYVTVFFNWLKTLRPINQPVSQLHFYYIYVSQLHSFVLISNICCFIYQYT